MHIVEIDVGDLAAFLAHLLVGLAHSDPRLLHVDEERGNVRVLGQRFLAGARHDQAQLREGRVGDVAFRAVQTIAVAVLHRGGLHRGAVGAAARLGQAETCDFARGKAGQPLGLLRLCARLLQRGAHHAEVDRGDRAIGRQGVGQHTDRLDILRGVHPCAAVFLRHGQAEQAHLAHLVENFFWNRVGRDHVFLSRNQPLVHVAP